MPALDGIRAVAVALVLADHGGIPGVPGGFIGVDVFFVLSGFLITSLLLDELGRTGGLDLSGFWVRRARRLLPALIVMVLAVVVLRELFPSDAVAAVRDDAVGAFFWVANWVFIFRETDYFTQGDPPSPLQHTWSLAVEEQYYVVWPLVLLAVAVALALATRRRATKPRLRTVRMVVFGLALAGAAASAVESCLMVSEGSLNRVYFGTDTRVQALLVGAAAAAVLVADWPALARYGSQIRTRWGRVMAQVLPVIGLTMLAVVAHFATGSAPEFRRGLLIVVALAAVFIVAPVALEQRGLVARVLAFPPLVWLGVISYGVYLWHWPIFLALNGERTGLTGLPLFAIRAVATVAVAAISWWLIERPIKRWRPAHVPQLRLAVATLATAAVATTVVVPIGIRQGEEPSVGPDVLAAAVHPEVPVEVGGTARVAPGTRTVAVFGDSMAWTMMRYLPPTPGFKFIDFTTIGCGIARGGPYRSTGETLTQKPECETWPARWAQRISHAKPDVALLIIGRWETVDRVNEGHWTHVGEPGFDGYIAGELRRSLDILGSTGARVVVTTTPYNRRGEQPDGSLYPEDEPDRIDAWNALLRRVVGTRRNATVLDLNEKLCPDGYYTNRVDGIKMRMDGLHPTPEAVRWLTPWLQDALRK
ncbi:acyltransferase family protein [Mycolicibacterium sp. 120270]|nr:acyltransferase family protein [Mycolicibacterium sp. 120270]MDX1885123.1 acyltransferase family protein [Mycolicibacterium sp. 120270]